MTRVFLFFKLVNQNRKGVNYHQKDESSSTFTSVKKTSSLDNIFTFRDSENILKKTPLRFFTSLKRIGKKTRNFDTRFREHDQSVEMNAQGPFLFFRSTKNLKNELPHGQYCSFLSLQKF